MFWIKLDLEKNVSVFYCLGTLVHPMVYVLCIYTLPWYVQYTLWYMCCVYIHYTLVHQYTLWYMCCVCIHSALVRQYIPCYMCRVYIHFALVRQYDPQYMCCMYIHSALVVSTAPWYSPYGICAECIHSFVQSVYTHFDKVSHP